MAKLNVRTSVLVVVSLLLLVTSALTTASAQRGREAGEGQTLVSIMPFPSEITVPIEITAAKFRGQEIKFGKGFASDDDWIRHLEVTVKNVSETDIVGIVLHMEFPSDSNNESWLMDVPLRRGNDYSFSRDLTPLGWTLKPGETDDMSVSNNSYDLHRANVAERTDLPIGMDRRVQIVPEVVAFSPDSVWVRGRFLRRNLNKLDSDKNWVIDK